jgi:hypothetical protein
MKANRAFFAGILGGIVMTIIMALLRQTGAVELNYPMLLGTMAIRPGMEAWITGFFLHLLLAGLFAMLFGEVFEIIKKGGALPGIFVGIAQAIVVGIILGVLPAIHPNLGETMPVPGFFAINYGWADVLANFGAHLVFGLIVGGLYATPLRAGETSYLSVARNR